MTRIPRDEHEHAPTSLDAPPLRHDSLQADADRIIANGWVAAVRAGFPKPSLSMALPVERAGVHVTADDLAPASCVELDDVVGEDSIILTGRDPITGKVRLKIWMAKEDASPEWGLWIRRWLTKKSRLALRLLR